MRMFRHRVRTLGATAAEYMIALILIALVVLGIAQVFGGTVESKFADANSTIGAGVNIGDDDEDPGGDDDERGPARADRRTDDRTESSPRDDRRAASESEPAGLNRYKKNQEVVAKSEADEEEKRRGSSGTNNKTTIGSGGEGHKPTGGPARRPLTPADGGCKSVNPLFFIGAGILIGLLFFVMGSGKRE